MDTTLHETMAAFLAQRRIGCARTTMESYRQIARSWLRWREATEQPADLLAVTLGEIRAYLARIAERCEPSTVHNHYRMLRTFWRWAVAEELVPPNRAAWFLPKRIVLPRVPRRARPAVQPDQVEQLLQSCGDDEDGRRNRAVVLLLWESGLRVSELAGLDLGTVDLAEREARIIGKGDKEGWVWWGPRTAAALRNYLAVRRGPAGGALFRGVSSRNNGGALTANAVRLMVKRLAKQAGVELPKGAVVHGFRHGCARELRRRGCTKEEVRDILRHADLETTERYLGEDTEAPRAAHRRAYDEGRRHRDGA